MRITLIRGGNSLSLTDEQACWLLSLEGMGEPPVRRLEERGPQQHGVTDTGFRLEPRVIQLALEIRGQSLGDLEAKRRALIDWMRPSLRPLGLRFELDDHTYQIDGHSIGAMAMPLAAAEPYALRTGLAFRCPDPTFYEPVGDAVSFFVGGGSDPFVVPTPIPAKIGSSVVDGTLAVAYGGTWRAYPLIRITGPIADCVIENESTGETLDLTGTTIADGDWYELDMRYGAKTIVDQAGANQLSALSADSDLATFHLADDSEVTDGINVLHITGTGADANTRIDVSYHTRYVGI